MLAVIRYTCGAVLIFFAAIGAYWWFYLLAPVRNLADPAWLASRSEKAKWEAEQKKYHRLSESPDLFFANDVIGYYGDRYWFLWVVDKMHSDPRFRVCGCTETVLSTMSNRHEESWREWAKQNRDRTQEEWIRDGFAQLGVELQLPPHPDDWFLLLEVLGSPAAARATEGSQPEAGNRSFPGYARYNAFRWLRDSGFDQTAFAISEWESLSSEALRAGLMNYTKWLASFPGHEGLGVLRFGLDEEAGDDYLDQPLMATLWFRATVVAALCALVALGLLFFLWPRQAISGRVKSVLRVSLYPVTMIFRWGMKNRGAAAAMGGATLLVSGITAYMTLPVWNPEWVIQHSKSPKHVLRAASHCNNGHFDATPALQTLLGPDFSAFLIREVGDVRSRLREQAASILAYSEDEAAEQALVAAIYNEADEIMKRSLLFYLGWTAGEGSRALLMDILEGRIAGPRSSALRTLGRSSIPERYEIVHAYLDDAEASVKEEARRILERREEREFEAGIKAIAESKLKPLALRLVDIYPAAVPPEELPDQIAGRPIRWGFVRSGHLDIRFGDRKHGILIDPHGGNVFPLINGYFISSGTGGIRHYFVVH